jgi:hypothetical protein
MLGSVISSIWRMSRGSGGVAPFESPLLQIARRLHRQRVQLTQQPQPGQLTQQQPMQPLQQAEQPMAQPAQPMQPGQPMQPTQTMPSVPVDQNQFMHSLLSGVTRSMFPRPWSMGQPGQQMPTSQTSVAHILMRLLGGW